MSGLIYIFQNGSCASACGRALDGRLTLVAGPHLHLPFTGSSFNRQISLFDGRSGKFARRCERVSMPSFCHFSNESVELLKERSELLGAFVAAFATMPCNQIEGWAGDSRAKQGNSFFFRLLPSTFSILGQIMSCFGRAMIVHWYGGVTTGMLRIDDFP